MFSSQRYSAKELALAYVSQQKKAYTPAEFLRAVEQVEPEFVRLLNTPRSPNSQASQTRVFEG